MPENLRPPVRPIDKSFRLMVSDVFKGIGTGFNVAGRVGSGCVQPGDKILIVPLGSTATIKSMNYFGINRSNKIAQEKKGRAVS